MAANRSTYRHGALSALYFQSSTLSDTQMEVKIKMISSGVNCLTHERGTFFHGATLTPNKIAQAPVGKTIVIPSFFSTAEDSVPDGFAGNMVFEVSGSGAKVLDLSFNPMENEILFQAGTTYNVRCTMSCPMALQTTMKA